jgi:hypothetical protein
LFAFVLALQVPTAADAATYYSAFSSIKAQGFRVIVMMVIFHSQNFGSILFFEFVLKCHKYQLTVDSTALAAAQLVKLVRILFLFSCDSNLIIFFWVVFQGMTGGNYLYILNENMWQFKTISDRTFFCSIRYHMYIYFFCLWCSMY